MRKFSIAAALVAVLLASSVYAAGPQTFGKIGTATTTNATVTVGFHPILFCIRNDDATNGLYFDWTDGVASTVDESTNLYLAPGEGQCFTFSTSIHPFETFQVGVRSSAGTVAYHFNASKVR